MCEDTDLDDYEAAMQLAEGGPATLNLEVPELAGLEGEEFRQVQGDLSYAVDGFNEDAEEVDQSLEGAHWLAMEEHMLFYAPAQKDFYREQHTERYYTPQGTVNQWERAQSRRRKAEERERDPEYAKERSRADTAIYRARHPDKVKAQKKAYAASDKGKAANRERQRRYRERQKLLKQQAEQFKELNDGTE